MKQPIDTDIDICFDGIRAYFVSGATVVSDLHLFKQYRAAIARIAELENEVATLMLTPPLPEWKGKRVVAVKDSNGAIYDGEAFQDFGGDVLPGWRPV